MLQQTITLEVGQFENAKTRALHVGSVQKASMDNQNRGYEITAGFLIIDFLGFKECILSRSTHNGTVNERFEQIIDGWS